MQQTCVHCGGRRLVAETIEVYPYTELGLDHVTLSNVERRRCPVCDETSVVIPMVTQLHLAIAMVLLLKPSLLTGKEIRFFRSFLGYSELEFATLLYVSPQDLLFYEAEDLATFVSSDRIIRALFVIKAKFHGFWPKNGGDYERVVAVLSETFAPCAPQCRLTAEFDAASERWAIKELQ